MISLLVSPLTRIGLLCALGCLGATANAQVPVVPLGSDTRDLGRRGVLASDELRRSVPGRRVGDVEIAPSADGSPMPWWEGSKAVALQSMQNKRFTVGVGLQAGWEYDDNLFLSEEGNGGGSSYFLRVPITAGYEGGRISFTAAYSPEYRMYDVEDIDDSFNQALSGGVYYKGEKTSLGLDVNFAQNDGANIDVGDRVDSLLLLIGLKGSYEISPKTTLGAFATWDHMDYDQFNSYDSTAAAIYADYKITPKTSLGLQTGYERDDVSEGLDSDAVNVALRAAWQASEKLSFRGSAGYEWREYDGGDSLDSPVFSLGFLLYPRETTSVSLDVYRRNSPSVALVNQSYYATGAVVTLNQAIADRFRVTLDGGYEYTEYEASDDDVDASREDSYWYIRPGVSYTFAERATLNVYYQYSQNDSSGEDSVDFERNLVGASLLVNF